MNTLKYFLSILSIFSISFGISQQLLKYKIPEGKEMINYLYEDADRVQWVIIKDLNNKKDAPLSYSVVGLNSDGSSTESGFTLPKKHDGLEIEDYMTFYSNGEKLFLLYSVVNDIQEATKVYYRVLDVNTGVEVLEPVEFIEQKHLTTPFPGYASSLNKKKRTEIEAKHKKYNDEKRNKAIFFAYHESLEKKRVVLYEITRDNELRFLMFNENLELVCEDTYEEFELDALRGGLSKLQFEDEGIVMYVSNNAILFSYETGEILDESKIHAGQEDMMEDTDLSKSEQKMLDKFREYGMEGTIYTKTDENLISSTEKYAFKNTVQFKLYQDESKTPSILKFFKLLEDKLEEYSIKIGDDIKEKIRPKKDKFDSEYEIRDFQKYGDGYLVTITIQKVVEKDNYGGEFVPYGVGSNIILIYVSNKGEKIWEKLIRRNYYVKRCQYFNDVKTIVHNDKIILLYYEEENTIIGDEVKKTTSLENIVKVEIDLDGGLEKSNFMKTDIEFQPIFSQKQTTLLKSANDDLLMYASKKPKNGFWGFGVKGITVDRLIILDL